MAQVTITINSREYAVACEDGQEARIYQLADVLNEKAIALTGGSMQVNENMLLAMVGLVLADELSEIKKNPHHSTGGEESVIDQSKLQKFDAELADKIKSLDNKLNLLVSELNLL